MTRHGKTSAGRQRWRCKPCQITSLNDIDATAKHLGEFLAWLLSGNRQADMPGGGRSFRRRCRRLWEVWPLSPMVDEVYEVVFVDGIHLGRKAVVLIAQTREHVLGWYVARSENSRAWEALMSRIAPPEVVVCDGGSGFEKARKRAWSNTRVQRCAFHAFGTITQATTTRPKLACSRELYQIGKQLLHVKDREQATSWVEGYLEWCRRWEVFLAEKTTREDGGWEYTHERLVRARNSVNRLLSQGVVVHLHRPQLRRVGAGDEQPNRRGHQRALAPTPARSPWNEADAADQGGFLVVLHAHRKPAPTRTDPQDHAHRRSD